MRIYENKKDKMEENIIKRKGEKHLRFVNKILIFYQLSLTLQPKLISDLTGTELEKISRDCSIRIP